MVSGKVAPNMPKMAKHRPRVALFSVTWLPPLSTQHPLWSETDIGCLMTAPPVEDKHKWSLDNAEGVLYTCVWNINGCVYMAWLLAPGLLAIFGHFALFLPFSGQF